MKKGKKKEIKGLKIIKEEKELSSFVNDIIINENQNNLHKY